MYHVDILGLLELLSIVISTALVILSMTTVTKTSNGRLTKWGLIVLIGIIIANAFSFSRSYIKQKQEQLNTIHALEEGRRKDSTERVKYANQINLLFENIDKSDSSLKQQFQIQQQTENVLKGMSQSITIQKEVFTQSGLLNQQQKNSLKEIHRTLNPIFPFRISLLELVVQQDKSLRKSNPVLTDLNNELLGMVKNKSIDSAKGLELTNISGNPAISITKNDAHYKKYLSLIGELYIDFSFQKEVKGDNPEHYLFFEPLLRFIKDSTLYHNFQIIFTPNDTLTTFLLWDLPIKITSDKNFVSIDDIDNSKFEMSIIYVPGRIVRSTIRFNLPPDYTTEKNIEEASGTNYIDPERPYYEYSYKKVFKEEPPVTKSAGPFYLPFHR